MNKNIEVISKNLWAVSYSMTPLIKEIDIEPTEGHKAEDDLGRITADGLLVLNKGFRFYGLMRVECVKAGRYSARKLAKVIKRHEGRTMNEETAQGYAERIAVALEAARRDKENAAKQKGVHCSVRA